MKPKMFFFLKLAMFATLMALGSAAWAQSAIVITTNDSGAGSLRYAVSNAINNETITFDPSLSGQTILLTSGQINLATNCTIDASSLPGGVTVSGNNNSGIFNVGTGANVSLTSLTMINGNQYDGGAIDGATGSSVTVTRCTLSGNSAVEGGALLDDGAMTLIECTLAGNSASYGGAMQCRGATTISQCTISGNSGYYGGGGLWIGNVPVTVSNSIIAGNSAPVGSGLNTDIEIVTGTLTYASSNLVQFVGGSGTPTGPAPLTNAPMLSPLGNYGGPTQTMPPLPGSPAIDAGGPTALTTDQRGFPRLSGAQVDIGAVEVQFVTLIVSNTLDSGPGSLRQAIAQTTTNLALITFDPSLSGQTILLASDELLLTNNMTMDASALPDGIQINGSAHYRVFEVASNTTVVLNGLTITNGYGGHAGNGGGVDNSGTLTLNQCTVAGNSAPAGGAIFNGSGTMTLNECTVAGNSTFNGGGGGIYNASATMTLNECTLSRNSAVNGNGGGIYNVGVGGVGGSAASVGTLTLNECTLSGNFALTRNGGGIYNGLNTLTVNQCTLSGNSVMTGNGGGIYIRNGMSTVYNSIVAGNTNATGDYFTAAGTNTFAGVNLTNGTPLLAPLGNYGGLTPSMPPLPGSPAIDAGSDAVTNLFATDQRGLPRLSGLQVDIGAVEVQFVTLIVSNTLDSGAGSLRQAIAQTTTNLALITFDPSLSGQTILLASDELLLTNNMTMDASALPDGIQINGSAHYRVFEVASNTTVALNGLTITNGNGTNGGGIYNSGTLTLNECTVSGNSVVKGQIGSGQYGVIDGQGGGIYNGVGTLTLNECTVLGNSAASYGGGIYNASLTGTSALNQCTVLGNSASSGGGIVNLGTLSLNECTVSGNSSEIGGGIAHSIGTLVLNQCTLSGNSSANGGGGIYSVSGTLTVNQCTLSGNSDISGKGGGIYAIYSMTTFYNSIIAGNTNALSDFYATDSTNTFTGVNLTNGTPLLAPLGNYGGPTQTMPPLPGSPAVDAGSDSATSLFATDQRGLPRLSGLHVDIGAVEVQFVTLIVSNTLDSGAGSLRQAIAQTTTNLALITFDPSLSGQTILLASDELLLTNNMTMDASALPDGIQINGSAHYRVFEVASNTTVVLNGLTITNGSGGHAGNGGGVDNSGTLTLNQCTVAGNSAPAGGGIYNGSGTMTLNECTVAGNSAVGGNGGGIYNVGVGGVGGSAASVGTLTLNECTLSGNFALTRNGGGIYNGLNTLTVNQCTLSGNSVMTGNGGGIYIHNGMSTVYNSIIAGNTNATDDYFAAAGTNTFAGVNLTNGTPLLAPLGNYGGLTQTMPPLPGSPAVDAGSDSATSLFATDQRGLPRLSGLQVDIGAVEVQFVTLIVSNTLDSGAGSLRQTIVQALTNFAINTITFAPNLSGQTITLTSGEMLLDNALTIDASALPQGIQINGNANDRIFEVDSLAPVTLNSLTLTNGSAGDGYGGGAVLNYSTLIMNQCTLAGNVAGGTVGGGLENDGTNTLNECTLAGNSAGIGGGLFNYGTLALNQCTVSGNSANSGYGGGGVYNFGNLALTGSIIAGNAASVGADVFNEENLAYSGANLVKYVVNLGPANSVTGPAPINATPLLAPLGSYGGPTPTMPPLPGSPAIDAAGTTIFATDQRGFPRVLGTAPDLGAVEGIFNPAGPGLLTGVKQLGNGTLQFGFTNYTDTSVTVWATTNLTLPFSTWLNLGPAMESSPGSGIFLFSDPQAPNYPQRFYHVRSP